MRCKHKVNGLQKIYARIATPYKTYTYPSLAPIAMAVLPMRGLQDSTLATELLIARIEALRTLRGWSEAELSRRLHWEQSRLNKCMNLRQRFSVGDLDAIAAVFDVTVAELFFDEYGQWDRRSGSDRRKRERRTQRQTIYDPKLEPSDVSGVAFKPKTNDGKKDS